MKFNHKVQETTTIVAMEPPTGKSEEEPVQKRQETCLEGSLRTGIMSLVVIVLDVFCFVFISYSLFCLVLLSSVFFTCGEFLGMVALFVLFFVWFLYKPCNFLLFGVSIVVALLFSCSFLFFLCILLCFCFFFRFFCFILGGEFSWFWFCFFVFLHCLLLYFIRSM